MNTARYDWRFTAPDDGNAYRTIIDEVIVFGDIATYRWSKDLASFFDSGESDSEGTAVTFSADSPADGEVLVTATLSGTATDRIFVTVEVTQE